MNDFVKKVSSKISKLSTEQLERFIEDMMSQNDLVNSIMNSLQIGLFIVSPTWNLFKANKAVDHLIPLKKRSSEIEQDKYAIWDIVDEAALNSFFKECASAQKFTAAEEFSIVQDDKVRFVSLEIMPFVMHQEIGGSIITITDVTEKRQQEILLHRMESLASLTNLAASVAHEIKNPLGAISIHIQLLQKSIKKARERDGLIPDAKFMENYLDVINEEIENLNKIVVDFLFAVRPVKAALFLAEPDALIKKCVTFFKAEFEQKNIQIDLNLCENAPRILIDEKLFREVIINLAQNALAAIEERFPAETSCKTVSGCVEFMKGRLSIESFVKEDKYILSISDNGMGMDENTVSKIFEPYYTTKATGTGLGLTMVYKIIKEFRGDIDVKSVAGHGTVFTISIPVPRKGTILLENKASDNEVYDSDN
ncbi:MAG: two-component sensor histidine kinase [Treponema sp.]|mgnify:CR=1 FL=1|nr:two-component sensor histidine kinase [Treponema sp.]